MRRPNVIALYATVALARPRNGVAAELPESVSLTMVDVREIGREHSLALAAPPSRR
ncbi:exported hypothetical protein [Magnetospirillum sp. UT-4]|nr:exported hypothetical protein [Magnetospirillum sp. UT-4]